MWCNMYTFLRIENKIKLAIKQFLDTSVTYFLLLFLYYLLSISLLLFSRGIPILFPPFCLFPKSRLLIKYEADRKEVGNEKTLRRSVDVSGSLLLQFRSNLNKTPFRLRLR